jgi:hypothetical protein
MTNIEPIDWDFEFIRKQQIDGTLPANMTEDQFHEHAQVAAVMRLCGYERVPGGGWRLPETADESAEPVLPEVKAARDLFVAAFPVAKVG